VKVPTPPGRIAWFVLAYRLPVKSGLKTVIRRRLTALGAIYPANAVAAIPASPAAERAIRRLRSSITEAGGSAQVLRAEAIAGGPDLVAAFNAAREQEYADIIVRCGDFVDATKAMTAAGHFRYANLEEKDAELKSLSRSYEVIRARDALGAVNAESALSSLARCRAMLDEFARRVDEADAASLVSDLDRNRVAQRMSDR
jgi:ChrB-like protein